MRQPIRSMRGLVLMVSLLVAAAGLSVQTQTKQPVPYTAFDNWKSIPQQSARLSRNGAWLVYAITAQEGDGELVIRNLKTGAEKRYARGTAPVITSANSSNGLLNSELMNLSIVIVSSGTSSPTRDHLTTSSSPVPRTGRVGTR